MPKPNQAADLLDSYLGRIVEPEKTFRACKVRLLVVSYESTKSNIVEWTMLHGIDADCSPVSISVSNIGKFLT